MCDVLVLLCFSGFGRFLNRPYTTPHSCKEVYHESCEFYHYFFPILRH